MFEMRYPPEVINESAVDVSCVAFEVCEMAPFSCDSAVTDEFLREITAQNSNKVFNLILVN